MELNEIARLIGCTRERMAAEHARWARGVRASCERIAFGRASGPSREVVQTICANLGLDPKAFRACHAKLWGGAPGSAPFRNDTSGTAPAERPFPRKTKSAAPGSGPTTDRTPGSSPFPDQLDDTPSGSAPFPRDRATSPFEYADEEDFSQDFKNIARVAGVALRELMEEIRKQEKQGPGRRWT